MSRSAPSLASLLVETPPALASWGAFLCVRSVMRGLAWTQSVLVRGENRQWRVISTELLRRRGALAALMTEAPRWNPHAVIASIGPLTVRRQIRIEIDDSLRACGAWTIVVYRFRDRQTIVSAGNETVGSTAREVTWELPQGRYAVAVRCYESGPSLLLPQIVVDHGLPIEPLAVAGEAGALLAGLAGRTSRCYAALHHHVTFLLRHRDRLPESWVQARFLPVGNPRTGFVFGLVPAGARLRCDIDPALLAESALFATTYNTSSFPEAWERIRSPSWELGAAPGLRWWLLRVHPTERSQDSLTNAVRTTIIAAAAESHAPTT